MGAGLCHLKIGLRDLRAGMSTLLFGEAGRDAGGPGDIAARCLYPGLVL